MNKLTRKASLLVALTLLTFSGGCESNIENYNQIFYFDLNDKLEAVELPNASTSLGPNSVRFSISIDLQEEDRFIFLLDPTTATLSGRVKLEQKECGKSIIFEIPENYSSNQYAAYPFEFNPCGLIKPSNINVDLSGLKIVPSQNLIHGRYELLNPSGDFNQHNVKLKLRLHFMPKPGLFY